MIKNTRRKYIIGALAATLFSLSSCDDSFNIEPQDKLNSEQVYNNIYDADAVVVGIYGKFMQLAEKHILLNELRADLASPTENANKFLEELSEHSVSDNNPYASPKEFYELINLCNDALKNFKIMLSKKTMSVGEYNERYSDIGALRSWVYLQLGIHYGSVPYLTEPVENINDIKNIKEDAKLSFNDLLDALIIFTEGLPYTDPYSTSSSLIIDVDGYNTTKFFVNKECLLGDLHLWKGNYNDAASHYKVVMSTADGAADIDDRYNIYRIRANFPNQVTLAVGYLRYREQDINSLINTNDDGWRSMFSREKDELWNTEWIWSLPFDATFAPKNPFIDIFSPTGSYLVKPSQAAMDYWDEQTQENGFSYDARGKKFTYNMINDQPVIMKYLYNYLNEDQLPIDIFQTDGDWFLYRAGKLHLRFAEAANREGHHKLANALLNNGIQSAYSTGAVDVTDEEKTDLPFPYDFDARQGDFPYYRADWHRNDGIRRRAYVQSAPVVGDPLISIENNLIKESALELAYEGNRWEDILRIALRRNDPSFLADKVYQKLLKEGNPNAGTVYSKLLNPDNWYLPFTWEE
ncbi:RagB/SusD family nutrient uptake outer membrane protein [Wenyingzhuangia sp. IMCC45467]